MFFGQSIVGSDYSIRSPAIPSKRWANLGIAINRCTASTLPFMLLLPPLLLLPLLRARKKTIIGPACFNFLAAPRNFDERERVQKTGRCVVEKDEGPSSRSRGGQ